MNQHSFSTPARATAAVALALASLAAQADVSSRTELVSPAFSNEVVRFNLDVSSASDLRLWTFTVAYGAADSDPLLALFDRSTGALLSVSDDIDSPYPQVDPSQSSRDAGIRITDLAAGQYAVAVSFSPNFPAGGSWADGYLNGLSGGTPLDVTVPVRIELTNAAPIPEPTPTALLLAGLAVLGLVAGRRRG